MNDGQCIDGIDEFTCKCKQGWTGNLCDENIDDCANNSCVYHSECIDGIANYTCICKPGYTGRFCEIDINDCEPNPCENEGKIFSSLNLLF